MALGNAEVVIPYFEKNANSNIKGELLETNTWFLGLAYIKEENLEKVLQILSKILLSESNY
ncbi:MAG: hypothetical protein KTR26_12945 [Flammeovirgaceae bacterium]|nr:hypothetical protein [Flammeovirgaceae bacterium]